MTSIAIDARGAAEEPAGRGRVLRELLSALNGRDDPHRYVLYARSRWGDLDDRFEWRNRSYPDAMWHVWAAASASRTASCFLSTNSYLTAWFTRIPTAVVVYDTVAWDAPAQAQRRAQMIERLTAQVGLRRARRVICISDATRRDLVTRFPETRRKAAVVHLAADARFAEPLDERQVGATRKRLGLQRPFVLCVGTLEPRKNLVRVLEAFRGLSEPLRDGTTLAIVGPRGWQLGQLERVLGQSPGDIRVLDHVSDDDLVALYQSCELFCYPSLYEGFGLPLLEAMAAGAACVTSTISSLPEVGGDAVAYVDPRDVAAIRHEIERLLMSPADRAELGRRAAKRAATFSWHRTAAEVLAQLELLARTRS